MNTQPTKLKRPPSVIISTLLLGFASLVSLVCIVALTPGFLDFFFAAQTSLVWGSFLGLVFWGRAHVTRYLTSVTLALLVIKSVLVLLSSPLNIPPWAPGSPYAHILACLVTAGIASLFWRYTFGKHSRGFYRLSGNKIEP